MQFCHTCSKDCHPFQQVGENFKIQDVCPNCQNVLSVRNHTSMVEASKDLYGPMQTPTVKAVSQARIFEVPKYDSENILETLKHRLMFVSEELKKFEKLKLEEKQLVAMIQAAESIES